MKRNRALRFVVAFLVVAAWVFPVGRGFGKAVFF